MANPSTSLVPRDISKSVIANGSVTNAANGATIINPNPARNMLVIGATSQDLYVVPLDPVSGVPVTVPSVGGVGSLKIASGTFLCFGTGGALLTGGQAVGPFTATAGFAAISNAGASNLVAWEW